MVLSLAEISSENINGIGGKAKNLFLLDSNDFQVPDWVVIPYTELKQNLNKTVQEVLNKLPEVDFYAVRSSAIGEDSEQKSWAGQFESYLFVTPDKLEEKILAVQNSINNERVNTYRDEDEPIQMSVIVQVMVDADVSGVAFGINPVTGNRKQSVINAVFGVGEGLVSGELIADQYLIEDGKVQANVAEKQRKAVVASEGGLQYSDLPVEFRKKQVLSEKQLQEISLKLKKLYHITGKYTDIEFAYKDDNLYMLQTRPITTSNQIPDTSCNYSIWDNSNIIESYPGLTGPLTFSFIVKMYERVYIQMLELFGVKAKTIHQNKYLFTNMLGLIYGRVYYNLYCWYKVLSLLPGYSLNAAFMERMMGVKEKFVLDDYENKSKLKDLVSVFRMLWGLYRNIRKLPKNTKKFEKHFEQVMQEFWEYNLEELNPNELLKIYRQLEDELLSKWKPPLVNDFFAMIYFGLVPKMIEKNAGKNAVYLQNDLLCGANDIVSAEPARLINEIVAHVKSNPDDLEFFKNQTSKEVWQYLNTKEDSKSRLLVQKYLHKFGDRCVGELKLEIKTYKQLPENFIEILKTHINNSENKNKTDSKAIRLDAEKEIKKAFRGKPLIRKLFMHVLRKARTLVSNRENLRFRRTQAYGLVRDIFLALGKRFYAENLLAHPDDIFYLTINEIFDYIEGKALNVNLKNLVQLRQNEYLEYNKIQEIDKRFKTYGVPYLGNNFKNDKPLEEKGTGLKGIGCCAGRVKQRIRIVTDPVKAGSLNGEILVTASTDPGWVTLFSSISGIIVERGSLLSHSAIVSREMGIPCIVGVTNALSTLTEGDWVEMDGTTGQINIVESSKTE